MSKFVKLEKVLLDEEVGCMEIDIDASEIVMIERGRHCISDEERIRDYEKLVERSKKGYLGKKMPKWKKWHEMIMKNDDFRYRWSLTIYFSGVKRQYMFRFEEQMRQMYERLMSEWQRNSKRVTFAN